jgi:hypothetical protein
VEAEAALFPDDTAGVAAVVLAVVVAMAVAA